jgi:SulP family sulfate permease
MSQLEQFKTIVNGESVWLSGSPMYIMLGFGNFNYCDCDTSSKVTKAVLLH